MLSDEALIRMGGTWNAEKGWVDPPPEVIKGDPSTCPHAVLDELVGIPWGYEDCVTCGKRFPMRDEFDDWDDSGEPPWL